MLRRDIWLFQRGMIPALVLVVLFALFSAAAAFAAYRDAGSGGDSVYVALVDEDDSMLSRLCISLVEGQPFMQRLLSFTAADAESEAMTMLSEGECAAAIILPEGYLQKLMNGTPCTGRIVLSEAAAVSAEMVSAIARCGEQLIAAGQQGVFSGEELIAEYDLDSKIHDEYLNQINLELIDFALQVYDSALAAEETGFENTGVSMQSHYAACWLSLMLFVSGLFFQKLYTEDCRRPLLQRLFAAGIRPREYLCGKILFPAAFRLLLFAALLSLLGRVVPLQISAASLLLLLAAIAAAAVMVACTAVLLAGKGSWQGLILGVSALGLLLVGGLLPRGMLPAGLTLVGDFLPLGAIRAMLLPLFGGQLLWKPAVAAVVYAAVLLVLCLRALRCPTEKGGAV